MKDKTLIAIDFETADYKPDSACAIGMARIENMQIIDTFEMLIRPTRKHFVFTYIHGITWDDVCNEDDFACVWTQKGAQEFIANADGFLAHNASFDRKVLSACCIQNKIIPPQIPFYCSLKASRKFLGLPKNSLNVVADHFGIELTHHSALPDAIASAKIFINIHNMGHDLNTCLLK